MHAMKREQCVAVVSLALHSMGRAACCAHRPDSWSRLQQGVQQGLHGGYAAAPAFGAGALRNQAQGMLGAAEEAAGNAARRLTGSAFLSRADMEEQIGPIKRVSGMNSSHGSLLSSFAEVGMVSELSPPPAADTVCHIPQAAYTLFLCLLAEQLGYLAQLLLGRVQAQLAPPPFTKRFSSAMASSWPF